MVIKYLLTLITLFPYCLVAQQTSPFGEPSDHVVTIDCGDQMFTKVEQLPGFRISTEAFQDSLLVYLRSRNASLPKKKYKFMFVLTKQGTIFSLTSLQPSHPNEKVLLQAIADHAHLFKPANQNGQAVCMYAKLKLALKDKKINARFFQ